MPLSLYACPVCAEPLTAEGARLRCVSNHSFDTHKKGYINLLLSQNKRSKTPGDDAEMIKSRRRFLNADHYAPLAELVASGLSERISENGKVLDAGCGEGYYTNAIAQRNPGFQCYGLDISKPAIHAAASQYKNIHWCVASTTRAPYLSGEFNAIVSVFSRVDSDGFYRLLAEQGIVIVAAPDSDHLWQLRKTIYKTVHPYDTDKHKGILDDRFELVSEQRLTSALKLADNQAIQDLINMTPHAHKMTPDAMERVSQLKSLEDNACFKVYCYQKR